ncbi:MAG: class I SAM-dependent methyltransferase [Candidatus Zixiibacteriota bacterium]|nr:MAG: class I SAM-dependent methyltransferase [candidate division Zixibacteria bacterium]
MMPYSYLARFYDSMYPDTFSVRMVAYTLRILKKFNFEAKTALDVCCGTGTALRELTAGGLKADGLDRSPAMLSAARKKLRGRKVTLYRQALPRFEIAQRKGSGSKRPKQYDLITSYFDSLNYLLTERDLKAAFRSIYRHLIPGGWFVFDMNTVEMFKILWNEQPWVGIRDKQIWVMRSEFLKARSMTRLSGTFLEKQGRTWQRYDETHYERAYPNPRIRSMLRETGFQVKGFYHCLSFDPVSRSSRKFCAAARKPNR